MGKAGWAATLIFWALALARAEPGLAWGADGHRMVGQIGQSLLAPEARRQVKELLAGDSLASASTWADEVRSDPAWEHLAPYHYVNYDPQVGRFERCPELGCIVDGIADAVATLRDRGAPAGERVVALKLLVHFLGDLHQPLHVSHAADRGGNLVEVELFGEASNLHAVWDYGILSSSGEGWRRRARRLLRGAPRAQIEDWTRGSVVDWAQESYRLAVEVVYPGAAVRELGDAYVLQHEALVERRVLQAGVRLASVLNAILGDGSGEPGPRQRP